MTTGALYDLARKRNIDVLHFPMAQCGSMSVMTDEGRCYIGMDPSLCTSSRRERVHLSHETGSFYNIYATVDHRQRHENQADKWAILQLVPVEEFDEAIAQGCTELWELADRFGVTEDFMRKAVCYYVHGNLCTELYF